MQRDNTDLQLVIFPIAVTVSLGVVRLFLLALFFFVAKSNRNRNGILGPWNLLGCKAGDVLRCFDAGFSTSGLLFGNVSYISLSPTRFNADAGGVDRGSGLCAAALCILWIFLGPELTAYVPKFVVGGSRF